MRRIFLLCVLSIIGVIFPLHSQTLSVGLRNNEYVGMEVMYKSFGFQVEHSLFAQKFSRQYMKCLFSYQREYKEVIVKVLGTWGTSHDHTFYNTGVGMCASLFKKQYYVSALINPYYDSVLGYNTCYEIEGRLHCFKGIYGILELGNVPEYRIPLNRLRFGVYLSEFENLWVKGTLSVPLEGNSRYIRALCSFGYQFNL